MNTRVWGLIVGLVGVVAPAHAQVRMLSVRADGVLCLSCAHRVEKAIQRVPGVEKVQVRMQPVRAEVTPRGGIWLEPDRLRDAIKNAGFRPGDVSCTVSGELTQWQGQPALALAGGERSFVLEVAPGSPQAFEQAKQLLGQGKNAAVEVEGQLNGHAIASDTGSPMRLRATHVVAIK